MARGAGVPRAGPLWCGTASFIGVRKAGVSRKQQRVVPWKLAAWPTAIATIYPARQIGAGLRVGRSSAAAFYFSYFFYFPFFSLSFSLSDVHAPSISELKVI
jgi:hypothetical protein